VRANACIACGSVTRGLLLIFGSEERRRGESPWAQLERRVMEHGQGRVSIYSSRLNLKSGTAKPFDSGCGNYPMPDSEIFKCSGWKAQTGGVRRHRKFMNGNNISATFRSYWKP
jgi:hypothetical protein